MLGPELGVEPGRDVVPVDAGWPGAKGVVLHHEVDQGVDEPLGLVGFERLLHIKGTKTRGTGGWVGLVVVGLVGVRVVVEGWFLGGRYHFFCCTGCGWFGVGVGGCGWGGVRVGVVY